MNYASRQFGHASEHASEHASRQARGQTFWICAVATALISSLPLGAQQDLGRNGLTWSWNSAVPAGEWFRLYSVNGPLNVSRSPDNQLHVRADKRAKRGGDPAAVHFAVVRTGGGVTVCALWSDDATCDADGGHGNNIHGSNGRQNVEVTFTVQVPRGVHTQLNTVNGAIEAKGIGGELSARTVNGDVQAEASASPVSARTVNGDVAVSAGSLPVRAETVNGTIRASVGQQGADGDGKGDVTLRTVNGGIEITTPPGFNAKVDLSTVNGSVSSRYSLSYDRRRRHGEGTIGSGGTELSAHTVNGSVELH